MSFGTFHSSARDQELKSTGSLASTVFSNHSLYTDCPTCVRPGSSISRTLSEFTSSLIEANVEGCCSFQASAEERRHLPGCLDPGCAEIICDEYSHHEECCDDCVSDCDSDCGMFFDCDELDNKFKNTHSFEDSHPELFGDQTAQTFGFGRRLPQLAMENTMMESSNFAKIYDDRMLSTLPGYVINRSYPGSKMQAKPLRQNPWAPHTQPEATTPSRPSCRSALPRLPSHELTPASTSSLPRNSAHIICSSHPPHESPDPTVSTPNAHYDHINLLTEKSGFTRPFPPFLRCQWADPNGEPCGKTLVLGNDMHEHLRTTHSVKSDVFCRWVGCSVGVLEASPHRFASSVERHTWGHSGYRPYKCSACNEGFAAASVRDEHFTNIHLRKKVFSCDVCSHQCTSATNLKRHKDDRHSAERYQCEFCNRNGKRRLFPRGPNLARHFRNCKYMLAQFPEAAATGNLKADWLPPGYKRGHHGMERAKVTPPNYLQAQKDS